MVVAGIGRKSHVPLREHGALLEGTAARGRACAGVLSRAPRQALSDELCLRERRTGIIARVQCLPSPGRGVIHCDGISSVKPALLYKAGLTFREARPGVPGGLAPMSGQEQGQAEPGDIDRGSRHAALCATRTQQPIADLVRRARSEVAISMRRGEVVRDPRLQLKTRLATCPAAWCDVLRCGFRWETQQS
jgi:hypothetical protein